MIVVMGSTSLETALSSRLANEKTSLGEPINIVYLDKSDGVVQLDPIFMQHGREAAIKEYFFGDARRTLSPQIQQTEFDKLVIYKFPERKANPFFLALLLLNSSELTNLGRCGLRRAAHPYARGTISDDAALDSGHHERVPEG